MAARSTADKFTRVVQFADNLAIRYDRIWTNCISINEVQKFLICQDLNYGRKLCRYVRVRRISSMLSLFCLANTTNPSFGD